MRRIPVLALSACAAAFSGCVPYPKIYDRTIKGTAALEDGKPVVIKASLVKSCESLKGESEKVIRTRQTTTDAQGRYKLTIRGMAWNTIGLSGAGCESRIQMFVCREVCKPVDDIDLEVLGK